MTSEEREPAAGEERWRPSRRAKIAALVVFVLLVGGLTGGILVVEHNEDAPVDAVRAYVDAIAGGDASAANAMLDPQPFAENVDPDLLTDEVLGSAKQRIKVEDVRLALDADPSADVVDVQVNYTLGKFSDTTVLLRAKRAGTTLGVLDEWRVLDPLLVPVHLDTNEPLLDTATLGAATVPVGDPAGNERPLFVYPAVYELRGHESRYLKSEPQEVVATHEGYDERPGNTGQHAKRSSVHYRATPELEDELSTRLDKHLRACVAAVPKVPDDCPWTLDAYADFATGIKLVGRPTLNTLASYQVEYRPDGTIEPPLRFIAEGHFSYVNEEGEHRETRFDAYGRVTVTPDDDLTVTFTQEL